MLKAQGRSRRESWKRIIAMGISVAAVAACIAACGSSGGGSSRGGGVGGSARSGSSGQGNGYTLGADSDLSVGSFAADGRGLTEGYQAYFGSVNAHGGINGHKVNLKVLDDRNDPTTGVTNVKQLVESDHASGVFVFLANIIVGAAPVLEGTKTPAIVQSPTEDLLNPVHPQIFAGDLIVSDEPEAAVDYAASKIHGSGRLGVIAGNDAALTAYSNTAKKSAKARGWTVVKNEAVNEDQTNATAQADAVAAAKPNVVILGLPSPLALSAQQALRQQGYKGPIFNYDGIDYATLAQLKDPSFYVVRPYAYPAGPASKKLGAQMTKFITAAKAAHFDPTAPFAINGYEQAYVAGTALKACGYPCPSSKFQDALNGLSSVETQGLTYGKVSYSSSNHGGIDQVRIIHWNSAAGGAEPASPLITIKAK